MRSDTGSTEAVYQQFIDELEEIQTTTVDLPAITELAGLMERYNELIAKADNRLDVYLD